MDYSTNQLQSPDDEEEAEQAEAALTRKAESSEIGDKSVQQLSQETFFSYCHQQFDHLGNGSVSNQKRMQLMHENLDLRSKNAIPKRRKTEIIEVHNGRIVRSKGRKDRHSKVCTSRGPKDRRVRLSPGTAIQFYDVQDRLGYDRPSKAIDWLMKEAKSAIDALNAADQSSVNGEFKQMQKHDHLKNSENPISGVSISANGSVPSEFRAWPDEEDSLIYPSYQDGFLTTPSQIFETNLQRIFANTEYSVMNTLTGPQVLGPNHIFSQREPLQSSFINYPPISSEFQGLNFYSEELAFFTAGETVKGKDKIPLVSGKPSFQHKED